MKKVFAYILALTLIIAFAAGCTGNVNNVPGDALRPTEEPISIKGDKDLIDLRVNYEKDAECVDGEPVFSWTYNTTKRSVFQKNYRIRVALSNLPIFTGLNTQALRSLLRLQNTIGT